MKRTLLAVVLLASAGAARAEMVGDELAAQLADMGCVAEEEALLQAWLDANFPAGEFDQQATVLAERGELIREEDGRLRLVGWGECG